MPNIRNIIIFVTVAGFFVLIYIFVIKSSPDQGSLISSMPENTLPSVEGSGMDSDIPNGTTLITKDFLTLLLNVKNIKLDDAILSDIAFNSLHDSSITLIPDGTEGRPNPFAQFGDDDVPVSNPSSAQNADMKEALNALDDLDTLDTSDAIEELSNID